MVLFGPAAYIVVFLRSYRHTIEIFSRGTHLYSHYLFYVVEQLAAIALFGYGIFAGIQLWKTEPAAVTHAKRFLLLYVVYRLADFAMAINLAWIMGPSGTLGMYLSGALLRQLRFLVYPVVWYWYLLKSKRVRNTFLSGAKPPLTPN